MNQSLKLQRNEPCPCGSGKKYKKCCQNRVEEQKNLWKQLDYVWVTPELQHALVMVSGLKPDENEEVPDFEQLREALEELDKGIFNKELQLKGVDNYISRLLEVFTELLTKDDYFREMRLGMLQGLDILKYANQKLAEAGEEQPGQEKLAEMLHEAIWEWLTENIDERANDWFLWKIMDSLRKRSYTLEERAVLLFGIFNTLNDKPAENPFWEGFVKVVLYESSEAVDALEEMNVLDSGPPAVEGEAAVFTNEKMNELMQQNPTYRQEIMARISEITSSTMEMLTDGRLKLELPPYAVLGGLLVANEALRNKGATLDKKETSKKFDKRLAEKVEVIFAHLRKVNLTEKMTTSWIADYDILIETAWQFLEQWLVTEGQEMPEQERERVIQCKSILGSGHVARLSFFIYIITIVSFVVEKDSLLVLDSSRLEKETGLKFEEFFTVEGLEQYAGFLEKEEKTAAAEHVRKYKEQLET